MRTLENQFFLTVCFAFFVHGCGWFQSRHKNEAKRPSPTMELGPPIEIADGYRISTTGTEKNPLETLRSDYLIFSGSDPLASQGSASIHRLKLDNLKLETLLSGESSDAVFFQSGSDVLLFNRSFESRNYRRIEKSKDGAVGLGQQQNFPMGSIGDPHDVLYIGNDRALLAHYTGGQLVVMQQSSGKKLAEVNVNWDLPKGVGLHPEALVGFYIDDQYFVYVVHQGIEFSNGRIGSNDSQQVFVLEIMDDQIHAVDIDPEKEGVQGIKIKGTAPVHVQYAQTREILLVSMCSRLPRNPLAAFPCHAAVEIIDPIQNKAELVWDLSDRSVFMNGPVSPGPKPRTFFANVELVDTSSQVSREVLQFDVAAKTLDSVYEFTKDSGGYWGTFFDEYQKKLYVSDLSETGSGRFAIFDVQSKDRNILQLSVVPYAGVFSVAPR